LIALQIEKRNATLYNKAMIKTFRHKGLQAFFETSSKAGIQPHHAPKLKRQLVRLNVAKNPDYMNMPGWNLHRLSDGLAGHYSVGVNGNWRMTFSFDGEDAVLVDYQDCH
jgi:toxin HigB-1